jgi:FkbM family methyltransferase
MQSLSIGFIEFLISKGFKLPLSFSELVKGFYKRILYKQLLDSLKINCVIDAGANNGGFAKNLRSLGYSGYILSFEPDPFAYAELESYFANDSRWKGYNLALGSENTQLLLNINEFSVMNSFLSGNEKTSATVKTTSVEVKTLDSISNEILCLNSDTRIFLKMDTQGFDLEVMKGVRDLRDKIFLLQSEVSIRALYKDMPHYLESLQFYESLDFQLVDLFSVTRNSEGVVEYDAIMINTSDRIK